MINALNVNGLNVAIRRHRVGKYILKKKQAPSTIYILPRGDLLQT